MEIQYSYRREQIEKLYYNLEIVRSNMKDLITNNLENLTPDNLHILELEEEKILSRILKLKTLLNIN
jgi:type III secretory pathway lipoprotein EscJ